MGPLRGAALLALALALGSTSSFAAPGAQGAQPGPHAAAGPRRAPEAPVSAATPRPRTRAWLGVTVTGLEGQTSAPPGVTIARVAAGGPAEAAGLREGDVLVAVDGAGVADVHGLAGILERREPGARATVRVLRGLETMEVPLRLGTHPTNGPAERRVVVPLPPPAPSRPAREKPVRLEYAGARDRAFLGLETMDLQPGLAAYFGVRPGEGVLVETVEPGSPAEASGVRAGDVLLRLGVDAVTSGATFAEALARRAPGEAVRLDLVRDGRPVAVTATLGTRSIPVWVMDGTRPAPDRERALRELAEHHRREADRLQALLAGLEAGRRTSGQGSSSGPRPADEDLAALRAELDTLRARVRELEARLR